MMGRYLNGSELYINSLLKDDVWVEAVGVEDGVTWFCVYSPVFHVDVGCVYTPGGLASDRS